MQTNREPNKRTMTAFWVWSLGLHALAFAFMFWHRAPVWSPPPERVEIDFTAADELTPPPEADKKTDRRAAKRPDQQIIEQQHQLNDEVDADTRFLSAFNQKVLQQTRAARTGEFNNAVHGGPVGDANHQTDRPRAAAAKPARPPGELPALSELLPKYEARAIAADGSAAQPNDQPNGDPTRTDDYLKDVKPGLQTLISTREFVYYAYYNRIKAALRSHWEPEVRERVNIVLRQGRALASAKDRITQVVVTLDARGELVDVDVITQSGVNDLDEAAVSAFRHAAPFPNPPKGMLETDGTVKIRWDFVLEV